MHTIIYTLLGEGKELNAVQMACRAFLMFFITLAFIRLAGMRAFGQKSAFDTIIVIMLGALLSRAVTGASAFLPTIIAGLVMVLLHRLLGILSVYSDVVGQAIKGNKTVLYRNSKIMMRNMIMSGISYKDLLEEVRVNLNEATMDNVKEIFM